MHFKQVFQLVITSVSIKGIHMLNNTFLSLICIYLLHPKQYVLYLFPISIHSPLMANASYGRSADYDELDPLGNQSSIARQETGCRGYLDIIISMQ